MVFKCKICGGSLEIEKGQKIVTCSYCGVQQTLPKNESDRISNLYDRANHFLKNNEYDKAEAIYEMILNEDPTDGEAYWYLVLCKYGVEYVKDPKTGEYISTCNRTKTSSIFADEDYKQAIENSTEEQREIYKKQAKEINEIQKRTLEVSSKEEPYDVFICYKERDNKGERTQDSVLAQDIYEQLVQAGMRVFFSRITLEDKIGTEYEPYIFAALNSAKVMIVLGTNKEHFQAPWVRNEWSRYLSLIKEDKNKTLIPCYKDMDAYDMPEEFAHLQAQDMSKIGFIQDLVRGIKKIVVTDQKTDNTIIKDMLTESQKEEIYRTSKKDMQVTVDAKILSHREKTKIYKDLEKRFEKIGSYKDSSELAKRCNELYKKEKKKRNTRNLKIIIVLLIVVAIIGTILTKVYILPNSKYNAAMDKYNNKEYYSAIKLFNELGDYKESKKTIEDSKTNWRKANISSISGSNDKILAIKSIGTVYNLSSVFNTFTQVVQIDEINDNYFALKSDGTVESTLDKKSDYENITKDWTNVVSIKASDNYIYGLKNNGTVLSVKYKETDEYAASSSQIDTSSWSEIVQVLPCLGGVVGLKEDGTLIQSGIKSGSILKINEWKDIVQVTGSNTFLVGLKEDGTLVGTGDSTFKTMPIEKETNVAQLSCNYFYSNHFAFIKEDGTVKALGSNDNNQCDISTIDDIVFLYAGDSYTMGITKNKKAVIKGNYKEDKYKASYTSWSDIKINKEWRCAK